MTDPRQACGQLHRAAEVLRRTAPGETRGPWRWADPDPEAGAGERLDRPTSLKDLVPFSGAYAGDGVDVDDPVRWPGRPPTPQASHPAVPVDPAVAVPLAELLDALSREVAVAIDAGGSLADEPFRSALRLADVIIDSSVSVRPGRAG